MNDRYPIGERVKITVDRPLGSVHPNHSKLIYELNYGYIEGIIAPDGEEQDCYILGVNEPLEAFEGIIIAVIHRKNDIEDKWVASTEGVTFTKDDIKKLTDFQEKYFNIEIIM